MDTTTEHDPETSSSPSRASRTQSLSSPSPEVAFEEKSQQSKKISRSKKFNPMLILENSGSVARDHLASERTFLAYVRTSLAIASTGVALVQLLTISSTTVEHPALDVRKYAKPLGAAMVLFSILVLIMGSARYFTIQHALTLNHFPVARILIMGTSLVLLVLVIITFSILVTVNTH